MSCFESSSDTGKEFQTQETRREGERKYRMLMGDDTQSVAGLRNRMFEFGSQSFARLRSQSHDVVTQVLDVLAIPAFARAASNLNK